MATTSAIGSSASSTSASLNADKQTIAGNFDKFLLLLTTQLKNQNPLSPLDTNQFTQQLVQFSSVEQQLKTNETLVQLLSSTKSANVTNALGFVGKTVTADGATTKLSGGLAQWRINAARAAQSATISIKDSTGSTVRIVSTSLVAGDQPFSWDGRTSTGTLAKDGDYTISVEARDSAGQVISAKTEISGSVDSVDVSGVTPVLNIGNTSISADKVKTIVSTR